MMMNLGGCASSSASTVASLDCHTRHAVWSFLLASKGATIMQTSAELVQYSGYRGSFARLHGY